MTWESIFFTLVVMVRDSPFLRASLFENLTMKGRWYVARGRLIPVEKRGMGVDG